MLRDSPFWMCMPLSFFLVRVVVVGEFILYMGVYVHMTQLNGCWFECMYQNQITVVLT